MSDSLSGTDALSSMSPCKTMMSISLYFIPLRRTGMILWGRVEERWEGSERREERERGEDEISNQSTLRESYHSGSG